MSKSHAETSDWQGLRDDPLCARARKLLSFEELRAIMRHARNYERERVAQWMIAHSIPTGHGDTIEDLLSELGVHIERQRARIDKLLGREP